MELVEQHLKRFAGLDLAKESIYACIVDNNGLKLQQRFGTALSDLVMLHEWLQTHHVTVVAMESTGIYTEPVVAALKPYFLTYVVNPSDTKRANRKKTDPDDAWWLAELLRVGTIGKGRIIEPSYLPTVNQSSLRILTRKQARMTEEATTVKNRITKTLARLAISLPDIFGDDKFTQTALALYEAFVRGQDWQSYYQQLEQQQQYASGKVHASITRQMTFLTSHKQELEKVLGKANASILGRSHQLSLLMDLHELKEKAYCLELLARDIDYLIDSDSILKQNRTLLLSIPGIGKTTAPQILAELPDLTFLSSAKKFASFCGLVPKVDQSAEITHRGHITRRGSPYLRRALFQSAKIASMQTNTKFGRKFKKLYHRKGKGKGKLCWIGIARMLAEHIYTLLLRQEEYKEDSTPKKRKSTHHAVLKQWPVSDIANDLHNRGYTGVITNDVLNLQITI